jgi:hypothetical protein
VELDSAQPTIFESTPVYAKGFIQHCDAMALLKCINNFQLFSESDIKRAVVDSNGRCNSWTNILICMSTFNEASEGTAANQYKPGFKSSLPFTSQRDA